MHEKKFAQLAFRSMHFAIELSEFYISYNGRTWSYNNNMNSLDL